MMADKGRRFVGGAISWHLLVAGDVEKNRGNQMVLFSSHPHWGQSPPWGLEGSPTVALQVRGAQRLGWAEVRHTPN